MTWVLPHPKGTFEPLDEFEPGAIEAIIEPVEDEDGEIIDAVAWSPDDPSRWWLQRGQAVVLGAPEIAHSGRCGAPLTLVETPEAWTTKHHAAGAHWCACVVRWDGELAAALSPAWEVIPATGRLRQRLDATLRNQWRVAAACFSPRGRTIGGPAEVLRLHRMRSRIDRDESFL